MTEMSISSKPLQALTLTSNDDLIWKKELANATRSVEQLLVQLNLESFIHKADLRPDFKCLVTESYFNKIEKSQINDPLLAQVLPLAKERDTQLQQWGYRDPVADLSSIQGQGLIHKYHARALLISTGACAIHCRYCFRRHFPYENNSYTSKISDQTLSYLHQQTEINELILSGGDPLVLDNQKLSTLFRQLESITHIKTLRLHTRLPVVLPSRINTGLIDLLQSSRFKIVLVIHTNHSAELQAIEYQKLSLLANAGITLLNQSVLLKGVNDDVDTLVNLSRRLFECHTLPYYLHLFDKVSGAMHFETSKQSALVLKNQLESRLPGYLVPKLVEEIAGKPSKDAIFCI